MTSISGAAQGREASVQVPTSARDSSSPWPCSPELPLSISCASALTQCPSRGGTPRLAEELGGGWRAPGELLLAWGPLCPQRNVGFPREVALLVLGIRS